MKIAAAHLLLNNFTADNRVLKELTSIAQAHPNDQFVLLALAVPSLKKAQETPKLPEVEDIQNNIKVVRISLKTPPTNILFLAIRYFEWGIKVCKYLKKHESKVIHCHDLNTLLFGVCIKKKSTKLIYDAHELETEMVTLNKISRFFFRIYERLLIKKVDQMITVTPSIKKFYENVYPNTPVLLIRNIPDFSAKHHSSTIFRDLFHIPTNAPIFLYQGVLAESRGVDILLEIFSNRNDNKHLVCMGYGPLESVIQERAKTCSNIHFHPAVPMSDIWKYTGSAEIGFSLSKDICLSYRYSLGNKLFEYILSGILVIGSNFPDTQDIISTYKCGWTIPPTYEAAKSLVDSLKNDDIFKLKNEPRPDTSTLNWKNEALPLIALYEGYLSHSRPLVD